MIITEVWVPGNPRTKGSLLNNQDTPQSKRWRALMAEQVRRDIAARGLERARPGEDPFVPYVGAVEVELVAFLNYERPKDWPEDGPAIWHNAGDVDKLARNVLDAIAADAKSAIMNGGAIVNDNQVIRLVAEKYAAAPGEQGLWLRVSTVDQIALAQRQATVEIAVTAFRRAAVDFST
jgi:hypothetical protein